MLVIFVSLEHWIKLFLALGQNIDPQGSGTEYQRVNMQFIFSQTEMRLLLRKPDSKWKSSVWFSLKDGWCNWWIVSARPLRWMELCECVGVYVNERKTSKECASSSCRQWDVDLLLYCGTCNACNKSSWTALIPLIASCSPVFPPHTFFFPLSKKFSSSSFILLPRETAVTSLHTESCTHTSCCSSFSILSVTWLVFLSESQPCVVTADHAVIWTLV